MIQHIKNYKIFLTKVFLIFTVMIFTGCRTDKNKKIFWYDLREKKETSKIILEFRSDNKIVKKSWYSNKTKGILLSKGNELFTVEHSSSFCTKIISSKEKIDIYVFPNNNIKSDESFYYLPENENIYAYFVEAYDFKLNKNYYIFSKDNKIDKNAEFDKVDSIILGLEKIKNEDFCVYNKDSQILAEPYAGYIIKNSEGEFLMLSTLWDTNSF